MTTPWFGLHLPLYSFPDVPSEGIFDRIVAQAQAAEAAGFSLVTVMDHLNQIPGIGRQDEPMLEGWSVLAALARETKEVRLSSLVSGVTYRNPALIAKTATTLDVISGGRALFGLGAAWFEGEHDSFGFEFPPIKERMDRLDEALSIVRGMFAHERSSFHGRFYHVDEVINVPRPVQPGGPPILVGGGGEQRTLRIAAKHADMTHWFPMGFEALQRKTDLLTGYCEAINRDPTQIERTMATPVIVGATESDARVIWEQLPDDRRAAVVHGTPEQAAEGLQPYLEAGFTGFTFNNNVYKQPEQIAVIGDLLRRIGG
jgi:F420-dependent oxidoreductase-like protein